MGSYTFYCGCGYVSHDIDDDEHTPEPGNCCNCGGRKCMDCVLRCWHDECEDSCPECCEIPEPEPKRILVLSQEEYDWLAARLDQPARDLPRLREFLTRDAVFGA